MNFHNWISHWAAITPDKPAIIFADRQYSYSALANSITRLAAIFREEFEIGEGDRIAYLGNNSTREIEALFASAQIGAILVPLNWRLAEPELRQVLKDAAVSLIVVGQEHLELATKVAEQLTNCRMVHACRNPQADKLSDSWSDLQSLLDKQENADRMSVSGSDNPVLILYTSGTTGRPKGVVLTQSTLQWSARNSVNMHDMTAADHILTVLPLFHAGGLNIQTLPALSVGATVNLHPKYDPQAVLASIATCVPSMTALVPAQILPLVAHPQWSTTDMSRLRCVTTGSTFVPDTCIAPWTERGVTVLQVYGTTETCAVAIHQRLINVDATAGSVGFAATHCRIRIVDEAGHDVASGRSGEILIKGVSVFSGYWGDPEGTNSVLRDGWFYTGDIGYRRADGAYVISDRKADLIISGGENIYPAELEAILCEHPEIAEAAAVGQPDERWGEVPVVVVVTNKTSGLDEEGIKALFSNRLARFKQPRRVILLDELPRNAMGKIEKFELRKKIAKEQE